ncbi:MAG: B12-binding domain-containing radical SAM protein [Proteobacteria bacterium]|nr:B12-binding domain-containing radical SAM protein [Pseudomonadota bacterium]
MISDIPNILLVNPWIHDFAAYDYWAKPVGLLYLASILREHECKVAYVDCLNRFHPENKKHPPSKADGRGSYLKTVIPKPEGLEDIPRNYSRYGISEKWLTKDLLDVTKPDVILITSHMTYWYPGLFETIRVLRKIFPAIPVLLGGIYATLCYDHAVKYAGADRVFAGAGEKFILELITEYTGFSADMKFNSKELDSYPYPAFDLESGIAFIPILTSRGCPFSCSYCASHFLNPERMLRTPESVINEIMHWHEKYKVEDFAIYDDAFLTDAKNHAIPILEGIIGAGINVRFHTPNAIHIREISGQTADLMFKAGFQTIRLGLETTLFENRTNLDRKVSEAEFKQAVIFLKKAGFSKNQVGAYLLAGLPGQDTDSITESIKTVRESGITPVPAYYSPIPHTGLWEKAIDCSRYDLEKDPVFTNNAIFPCRKEGFSWEIISLLKKLAGD